MRILPLIVIVACLACHVLARPQEDAEAKPAPARGLLKRGPPNKGKTTTTTPAPAHDEGEYDEEGDEEGGDNVEQPQEASTEAPPSSTEGKKLVGSGVRPFRSNTDLLETLKKKRAQALEARHSNPQPAHEDVVSKSSFSKKRNFNTATRETKSEEAPAASPAKSGKSRFTRPSSRVNLEVEEEQVEPTPSPRTGRTFARRGN